MIRRVIYDVEFRVLVKEKLNPTDSVLVTGSIKELGEWLPKRCVPLSRIEINDDGELWSTTIPISDESENIYFRYVIGQVVRADDDRKIIIKKCKKQYEITLNFFIYRDFLCLLGETFRKARKLILRNRIDDFDDNQSVMSGTTIDDQLQDEFPAIFGYYQGVNRTDIGWLTGQSEIQLRFHSNPLQIWSSKLRNSKISIKVSPIGKTLIFYIFKLTIDRCLDLNYQQENDESVFDGNNQHLMMNSKVFIQSAMLRLSGCEANTQNDYGTVVEKDDYLIVKIQTFEPENIAYHIDFYLVEENTLVRKHIGFAYVLPIHSNTELAENKRIHRTVPIIGLKHNPFVFFFVNF